MFDTRVTIVGNALNTPERRRVAATETLVARFKVATTSRRYDKETGRWVDGASLRVRVNCWRRLAENVSASVLSGDPLIVTGRMYTRDWIGDDGQRRVSYELDAVAVGHDLARGQCAFTRSRPNLRTTTIEDEPAEEPPAGPLVTAVPAARPEDHPGSRPGTDGAGKAALAKTTSHADTADAADAADAAASIIAEVAESIVDVEASYGSDEALTDAAFTPALSGLGEPGGQASREPATIAVGVAD